MWFWGDTEGEIRCQSLLHQLASWDQSFCENYCCGKEIMDQTVSEKFLMSHEVNLKCDKEPLENNQFLLLKLAPWNPICLRWLSCVTTSVTRICFERFLMQKTYDLPVVLSTNLRALGNKTDELRLVVSLDKADVVCVIECWSLYVL